MTDEQNVPLARVVNEADSRSVSRHLKDIGRQSAPTIPESFNIKDVLAMLAERDDAHMKQMMEFAKELKKPTEREQRELDDKDKRIAQHQQSRFRMAQAEQKARDTMRLTCQHATTHPGTGVTKHAWRAQIHAPAGVDPFFVPTCQQCPTQLPKIRATSEMLTQGVGLDQYNGLNVEVLTRWAEESWKGHEDRKELPQQQIA